MFAAKVGSPLLCSLKKYKSNLYISKVLAPVLLAVDFIFSPRSRAGQVVGRLPLSSQVDRGASRQSVLPRVTSEVVVVVVRPHPGTHLQQICIPMSTKFLYKTSTWLLRAPDETPESLSCGKAPGKRESEG